MKHYYFNKICKLLYPLNFRWSKFQLEINYNQLWAHYSRIEFKFFGYRLGLSNCWKDSKEKITFSFYNKRKTFNSVKNPHFY